MKDHNKLYIVLDEDGVPYNTYLTSLKSAKVFMTKWAENQHEPFQSNPKTVEFNIEDENNLSLVGSYFNETQEEISIRFDMYMIRSAYRVDKVEYFSKYEDL